MRWRHRSPPGREARSGAVGYAVYWSTPLQGCRLRRHNTRGDAGALPIREVGSRTTGHEATSEPSLAKRQSPESLDTWRRRSFSYQGGGIQSHWTRGDAEAITIKEAGSGATGHVATPEPSLAKRKDPTLLCSWRRLGTRFTLCFDLKLVCMGTRSSTLSIGTDKYDD
jgi:hypothetical protein